MNLNRVFLGGRLGKDPEIRYFNNGQASAKFSLATSQKYKTKDGDQRERTEWHNIEAFGKTAELCGEYLKKGDQAIIEGEIRYREYEKDGQKKYVTEIHASSVTFVSTSGKRGERPADSAPPPQSQEDIPF